MPIGHRTRNAIQKSLNDWETAVRQVRDSYTMEAIKGKGKEAAGKDLSFLAGDVLNLYAIVSCYISAAEGGEKCESTLVRFDPPVTVSYRRGPTKAIKLGWDPVRKVVVPEEVLW
jgi:hypothetical protein